jgi:hypothetical protein
LFSFALNKRDGGGQEEEAGGRGARSKAREIGRRRVIVVFIFIRFGCKWKGQTLAAQTKSPQVINVTPFKSTMHSLA